MELLPWVISALTIFMMFSAGERKSYTWQVGIVNQALWFVWIVYVSAWGLMPMNIAMWYICIINHRKWKQEPTS